MLFGCLAHISVCFSGLLHDSLGPRAAACRTPGKPRTIQSGTRRSIVGLKRRKESANDSDHLEGVVPDVLGPNDCSDVDTSVGRADDSAHSEGAVLDMVKLCAADAVAKCPQDVQKNHFFAILRDDNLKAKVRQALDDVGRNSHQQTKYITDAKWVVVIFRRVAVGEPPVVNLVGQFMTAPQKKQFCTLATSPSGAKSTIRSLLSRPAEEKVQCVMLVFAGGAAVGSIPKSSSEPGGRFTLVY